MNSLILSWLSGPFGFCLQLLLGESGDDLGPVLVSGFGRLSWVGVDGGLTGSAIGGLGKWATCCASEIFVGVYLRG